MPVAKYKFGDDIVIAEVSKLITLVNTMRAEFNLLRDCFMKHDHGAGGTYASGALRIVNATVNSMISGSMTCNSITAAVPVVFQDSW